MAASRAAPGSGPNLSILFHAPGLAERVPFENAIHYWVLAPGAGGIVGRLDLKDTWWAIVQGVDVATGEEDPVGMVHTLVGDDVPVEVIATDKWNCRMLLADRYQSEDHPNLLIAGDAAHLNPPWGGHGFNTCVGDAVNVAWKLAAVLNGWGGPEPARQLRAGAPPGRRPHHRRRRRRTTRRWRTTSPTTCSARTARRPTGRGPTTAQTCRSRRASSTRSAWFSGTTTPAHRWSPTTAPPRRPRIPIHYTPSAHPGCLLPHAWMTDGSSVYDHLGTGFTLIALPGVDADTAPVDGGRRRHGIPFTVLALTDGDVEGRPGICGSAGVPTFCWSVPTSTSPGVAPTRPPQQRR